MHTSGGLEQPPTAVTYQILTDRIDGRDHCVLETEFQAVLHGPLEALPHTVCGRQLRPEPDPTRWDQEPCGQCQEQLPEGAVCGGRPRRNRVPQPDSVRWVLSPVAAPPPATTRACREQPRWWCRGSCLPGDRLAWRVSVTPRAGAVAGFVALALSGMAS